MNAARPRGDSVTRLAGVGPALAKRLEKIGITRIADLLFHLPLRYEDRSRVRPVRSLRAGERATVEGDIESVDVVFRGRWSMLCHVNDGRGLLLLRFFHFSRAQQAALERGKRLRCFGEVRPSRGGVEMVHPEYRLVDADAAPPQDDGLTPVYPVTEGLGQGRARLLASRALDWLAGNRVAELLPAGSLPEAGDLALADAIAYVHRPPSDADIDLLNEGLHPAQRRLAFEELIAQRLSLRLARRAVRGDRAAALKTSGKLINDFLLELPFRLTGAQQRVIAEIGADVATREPMLRLLQGDVGSGKTVVAAVVALMATLSGRQCAIMAPTELLAEQHLRSFRDWFEPLGVRVAWLVGRLRAAARRDVLAQVASGEAQVVIGTHALFQESVDFHDLALAIIDEQHRFGVHQRLALRDKASAPGRSPHQLVMTATPIPRTLTMTAYADLDVSVLDELPPGRTPVVTSVISELRRAQVVERVDKACRDGRQAYWVCPIISESEALEAQAAEDTAAALAEALPDVSVGLVHGRLSSAEKDSVMTEFVAGRVQLLVATTVIEVGVDVPNASLMIIENAERMGLAQLHQLRGRVGRGSTRSHCVLLYKPNLSRSAKARLGAIRDSTDGFYIAEQDLKLRGPGEVLGTRQAGIAQMRVADLARDSDLLPRAVEIADRVLDEAPDQASALVRRWVGAANRYGQV